jgi:hypothetical protein
LVYTELQEINFLINNFNNLNINLIFLIKLNKLSTLLKKFEKKTKTPLANIPFLGLNNSLKLKINKKFFKKSTITLKFIKLMKTKNKSHLFFFFNRFVLSFLEFLFKSRVLFNLKKGTNKIPLKQISYRKFTVKYFKKNLKVSKQILGILYYSFLLKDSSMFVTFFRLILEKANIKLHKKLFLGLRKLIKDFFKPLFCFLGVLGVFFNIKGKIGVSGSAKKRRYYFYFGKHSITSRFVKMDLKFSPV